MVGCDWDVNFDGRFGMPGRQGQQMPQLKRFASAAAAMAMVTAPAVMSAATAAAAPTDGQGTFLPFSSVLRRCDFSAQSYVPASGYGRPTAYLRRSGTTVVAEVQMATATPNTRYEVRVIQGPRPSSASCSAGAEGVAAGVMHTDAVGAASVTVEGPVRAGATTAWVSIELPSRFSQQPEEFYTSDIMAGI